MSQTDTDAKPFDPLAPITPAQADALRLCTTKDEAEAVLGKRICGVPLQKGKKFRYAPFDLCPRWPSLGATCPRHPVKGIANPKWTTGKKAKKRKVGGRYPEAEKAQAVVLAALTTQTQAAKALGVTQQRISAWANGVDISEGAVKLVDDVKKRIVENLDTLADVSVERALAMIKEATAPEAMNVAEKAVKTRALLMGDPTEISKSLSDEAAVLARLRQRANEAAGILDDPERPPKADPRDYPVFPPE